VVVLFSDGVTEACRPDVDEEFGEDRLADALARLRDKPAREIVEAINKEVHEFTCGAPPADDITLVIAKRLES
jgi:serine phosphatase RsbU (regulator of sigma subunit)